MINHILSGYHQIQMIRFNQIEILYAEGSLPSSLATPNTPTESSAGYWPHGKKYHAFFALFGIVKYVCVTYIIPIDFVKT